MLGALEKRVEPPAAQEDAMKLTAGTGEQCRLLARVSGLLEGGRPGSACTVTLTGLTAENSRAMHVRQESGAVDGHEGPGRPGGRRDLRCTHTIGKDDEVFNGYVLFCL